MPVTEATGTVEAFYRLAGISVVVTCTDPSVAELVDQRLRPLRSDPAERADVTIEIRGPDADPHWLERPGGVGRPVYDSPSEPVEYFDGVDELYIDYGGVARMRCSPAEGRIRVAVTGTDPLDTVLATHPLFTVALLDTMKRFGRYSLHAATLGRRDQGVVVPGSSGAGKSTLTVMLVRAGFDFVSDDTVFLDPTDGEEIRLSGFPDEVDVTARTVAMFPELHHLTDQGLRPGRDKFSFRVDDVYGVAPLAGCRPAALVFPQVVTVPTPELEPLSPSEALVQLMPNLLATEPWATQCHLDVLADLVRTVPSYTLRPGSDPDAAAACIADLVDG